MAGRAGEMESTDELEVAALPRSLMSASICKMPHRFLTAALPISAELEDGKEEEELEDEEVE